MVFKVPGKENFCSQFSRSLNFSALNFPSLFCGGGKYKKKLSLKAIGKLIDLIFIDFNTRSAFVAIKIRNWLPFLSPPQNAFCLRLFIFYSICWGAHK